MLEIFKNAVTENEITHLQEQFAQLKSTVEFNDRYYITSKDDIRDLYNLDSESLIQQQRVSVLKYPVANFVRNIVNQILPTPLKESVRIMFSRSFYPVGIHVDVQKNEKGHTLMIPLTFDTRIKTIVWKETATGQQDLNSIFHRFQTDINSFQPQPKISDQLDLRNCWLGQPSIVDFLELDGMAEWQAGSIFKFSRRQLHASNNYKEFAEFKDYVLIHNDE
jgi:hypothetical protein